MLEPVELKFTLDTHNAHKLENIVEELYKKKSIMTNNIKDFLVLTSLIIIDEYEKNMDSLHKFYHLNSKLLTDSQP